MGGEEGGWVCSGAIWLDLEVLLDDGANSDCVEFDDSDVIGIAQRLVVGDRGLKSSVVEYKQRHEKEAVELPLDKALTEVCARLT